MLNLGGAMMVPPIFSVNAGMGLMRCQEASRELMQESLSVFVHSVQEDDSHEDAYQIGG